MKLKYFLDKWKQIEFILRSALQEIFRVERKYIRWISESIDSNKKTTEMGNVDIYKNLSF